MSRSFVAWKLFWILFLSTIIRFYAYEYDSDKITKELFYFVTGLGSFSKNDKQLGSHLQKQLILTNACMCVYNDTGHILPDIYMHYLRLPFLANDFHWVHQIFLKLLRVDLYWREAVIFFFLSWERSSERLFIREKMFIEKMQH